MSQPAHPHPSPIPPDVDSHIANTCAILRRHGINAFDQGGDLVIFAVTGTSWTEVQRFTPAECVGTPDTQGLANLIAHAIADLVSGPHSHGLP